jgi:hypothetical protein
MLDVKGTKTIHTRMSMSDTKCFTLVETVTMSGIMLPSYLIFKSKPNVCIVLCKFLTFPAAGAYACKEKAWVDKGRMHEWINVFCVRRRKHEI